MSWPKKTKSSFAAYRRTKHLCMVSGKNATKQPNINLRHTICIPSEITIYQIISDIQAQGGTSLLPIRGGPCQYLGSEILHKSVFGVCDFQGGQIQYLGSRNLKKGRIVDFGAGLQNIGPRLDIWGPQNVRLNIWESARK